MMIRESGLPDNKDAAEWHDLIPPPDSRCGRMARPAHLRSLTSPSRQAAVMYACGSWACPACSARLRQAALLHYGRRLMDAEGVIFEVRLAADDWSAARRQLRRLAASWVRVAHPGGDSVVLGVTPSPYGVALADRELAVRRLSEELLRLVVPPRRDAAGRYRPISCSRDWTPPRRVRQYERVGWLRVRRPDELLAVLRQHGIRGRAWPGRGDADWAVTWAADQPETECPS